MTDIHERLRDAAIQRDADRQREFRRIGDIVLTLTRIEAKKLYLALNPAPGQSEILDIKDALADVLDQLQNGD